MPVYPAPPIPEAKASVQLKALVPLTWLLLVALVFSVNSASFGIKAAAGSGFISQVEELVFASNDNVGRMTVRAGIILPGTDADPSLQWLAIAPGVAPPALLPRASCYSTLSSLTCAYRANYYQQAPRAPPLA